MPTLKINDATFYYELHGHGKEALVLIGGFGCDHSIWNVFIEKWTPRFKILVFDNRGSGQTQDDNKAFSLETLAQDAYQLWTALDLEKPNVLGHSMGGSIALQLATQYSEKIGKLVILNSAAHFNKVSSKALESIINLQKAKVDRDLITDCFLPWGFSADFLSNPSNIENYKKNQRDYPFQQTAENNERQWQALNNFDLRKVLAKIKNKTLLIGTERDLLISEQDIQVVADNIPNLTLKKLAGSHVMLLEEPELFSKIILEFLAKD